MTLELWHFKFSHYNEKVRWALDHKAIEHERHVLVPGFHVPTVLSMTGQPCTPVIAWDGEVVWDSTQIIAMLEARVPEPALYPEDPAERERALALEDWFDENVGADVRRLFYDAYMRDSGKCARMSTDGTSRGTQRWFRWLMPIMKWVFRFNMKIDRKRVATAKSSLESYFKKISDELQPSGYLVGDRFSVADLTAASLLGPLARPPESYQLPGELPEGWLDLCDAVSAYEGCAWVRQMYAEHRL
jgi:glutathione S-transferase